MPAISRRDLPGAISAGKVCLPKSGIEHVTLIRTAT